MERGPELGLRIERHSPLIAAVLSAATCWWQWGLFPFPANWKGLVAAVFTASATGAGFLFTAASILMSMDRRPVIQWGRETGAYSMLASYLTHGVWWCLVAAFVTLAMFLLDFGKPVMWHRVGFCVWLAATVGAAVAVVRVLLIFAKILQQAAKDE
jgi:hypothetical protein